MKQILFPTAYTPHSKVAFRYAQKLAQYFGAGITLVHIYKKKINNTPDDAQTIHEIETNDFKGADVQDQEQLILLKNFVKEQNSKQFQDIPLDYLILNGAVREELLNIKNKCVFDFVVMGTSKQSFTSRLLGSMTKMIADEVSCPLLLIPPGASYLGINRIIYGTRLDFGDAGSVEYLREWSKTFKAKLHILHIQEEIKDQKATKKMDQLSNHLKEDALVEFKLTKGKIVDVLNQQLEFTGAEILAIHHRKQGFWQRIKEGNLTAILVDKVKIPILVLK